MLLYQDGGSSPEQQTLFFALGVSARKLYLEWKVTTGSLVEVGSEYFLPLFFKMLFNCLDFHTLLDTESPDIEAVTETFLVDYISDSDLIAALYIFFLSVLLNKSLYIPTTV